MVINFTIAIEITPMLRLAVILFNGEKTYTS